jgi:hypothetical protein
VIALKHSGDAIHGGLNKQHKQSDVRGHRSVATSGPGAGTRLDKKHSRFLEKEIP